MRRIKVTSAEDGLRDDLKKVVEEHGKSAYKIPNEEVDFIDEKARAFSFFTDGEAYTVIIVNERDL